jgi:hypothetical protein
MRRRMRRRRRRRRMRRRRVMMALTGRMKGGLEHEPGRWGGATKPLLRLLNVQ